jgi:hypothetical protein
LFQSKIGDTDFRNPILINLVYLAFAVGVEIPVSNVFYVTLDSLVHLITKSNLFLIMPTTANIIEKLANGMAKAE